MVYYTGDTSKKPLARRIGGIFSVIRYKNPSHRINYSCGFLISARKRADEKYSPRSPHDEFLEVPMEYFYASVGRSLERPTASLLVVCSPSKGNIPAFY